MQIPKVKTCYFSCIVFIQCDNSYKCNFIWKKVFIFNIGMQLSVIMSTIQSYQSNCHWLCQHIYCIISMSSVEWFLVDKHKEDKRFSWWIIWLETIHVDPQFAIRQKSSSKEKGEIRSISKMNIQNVSRWHESYKLLLLSCNLSIGSIELRQVC